MPSAPSHSRLHYAGRAISIGTMALALIVSLLVVHQVNTNPRTDDAEVFANFIGMAPLVNDVARFPRVGPQPRDDLGIAA